MAIEDIERSLTRSESGNYVRPSRLFFVDFDLETGLAQPAGGEIGDLLLTSPVSSGGVSYSGGGVPAALPG